MEDDKEEDETSKEEECSSSEEDESSKTAKKKSKTKKRQHGIHNSQFWPYEQARLYIHKLKLTSVKEWREFQDSPRRPLY